MNIENEELKRRIAEFPSLVELRPVISGTGYLLPVDYSRGIFGDARILSLMATEAHRIAESVEYHVIAGIELAGVPLATALALHTAKPMITIRGKMVRPGRPDIIGTEHLGGEDCRVLLVDDLVAFAKTKAECIARLQEVNTRVAAILTFIDFQAKYQETEAYGVFDDEQVPVLSMITWQEILDLQRQAGTMDDDTYRWSQELLDHLEEWRVDLVQPKLPAYIAALQKRNIPIPQFVTDLL
ncbi:MAG: hypothetical protein HYV34_04730 [Candidatus Kerfeldbacteria bacterium]|nr:hypothetical protein [Candidatus Kerfeldbacteria bacterium]